MSKKKKTKKEKDVKEPKLPFNGSLTGKNGVNNEEELADQCPDEFSVMSNPWLIYAHKLLFGMVSLKGWLYKSDERETRDRQYKLFIGIAESNSLNMKKRARIIAWMASKMLSEIPK